MRLRTLPSFFVGLLVSGAAMAEPVSSTAVPSQPIEVQPVTMKENWLGVFANRLPQVLSHQLSHILPSGEGVLVESISKDSPASKAGIELYDILTAFNGKKLTSPDQLSQLVRSAQAGDKVQFDIVRKGEKQELVVELGSHEVKSQPTPQYAQPFTGLSELARIFESPSSILNDPQFQQNLQNMIPRTNGSNVWSQFESMQVKNLGNDRYQASVEFQGADGNKKSFSFEGERDEIRQQIQSQKDLPEDKKQSLLRSLDSGVAPVLPEEFFKGFDSFFKEFEQSFGVPVR